MEQRSSESCSDSATRLGNEYEQFQHADSSKSTDANESAECVECDESGDEFGLDDARDILGSSARNVPKLMNIKKKKSRRKMKRKLRRRRKKVNLKVKDNLVVLYSNIRGLKSKSDSLVTNASICDGYGLLFNLILY